MSIFNATAPSGGGGTVKTATATSPSGGKTLTFTVDHEPTTWWCIYDNSGQHSMSTSRYAMYADQDGTVVEANQTRFFVCDAVRDNYQYVTWAYSGGTLTATMHLSACYFISSELYKLFYI